MKVTFFQIDILKETLLIKNTNFKSLPKTKIKYYLNDENFKSTAIQNHLAYINLIGT